MSNSISLSNDEFSLLCPCCGNNNFYIFPMTGSENDFFLKTFCQKCNEDYFFKLNHNNSNLILTNLVNLNFDANQIKKFQLEWEDWVYWKKKHLNEQIVKHPLISKFSQLLLSFILVIFIIFFVLDRWHLLDPLVDDHSLRQKYIDEYSSLLLDIPCLPSIMKIKIRTVPILYTKELPVKNNFIQFGEAGIYWGEEKIKIHRSNFWFFGIPKKTQLFNTLIHELRHHVNPELFHNEKFFELVDNDMNCVLENLNGLVKK